MTKGIIIIDYVPNNCISCGFFNYDQENCKKICWADYNGNHDLDKERINFEKERPEWCPIHAI